MNRRYLFLQRGRKMNIQWHRKLLCAHLGFQTQRVCRQSDKKRLTLRCESMDSRSKHLHIKSERVPLCIHSYLNLWNLEHSENVGCSEITSSFRTLSFKAVWPRATSPAAPDLILFGLDTNQTFDCVHSFGSQPVSSIDINEGDKTPPPPPSYHLIIKVQNIS